MVNKFISSMEQIKLQGAHINTSKVRLYYPAILWYVLAATGVILKILLGESHYNNFIIFRHQKKTPTAGGTRAKGAIIILNNGP